MASLGLVEAAPTDAVPETALVDPAARIRARAELDALVAGHVFELTIQELADLLDTFEVLRRRDEKSYGEFRTKRLILEAFERLN